MAGALKRVKDTLGPEALILSTRTLRGKGLGVLGKQTIEVTAAIESPAMRSTNSGNQVSKGTPGQAAPKRLPKAYRAVIGEDEEIVPSASQPRHAPVINPIEAELQDLRAQLEAQDVGHLKQEIDQLKSLLQELASTPQPAPVAVPAVTAVEVQTSIPVAPRPQLPVTAIKAPPIHSELDDLIEMLVERGIDSEAAATIARFADQQMNDRQRQEPTLCRELLTEIVADLVPTSEPLWQPGDCQKRVALIGPTGVGKTTTIAKLAAEAITNSDARVALVTIDTYRIAAVEQLKIYGEIMGLPVEVVITPDQLQEAFRRHRDKDLILIDTAGRSPRDTASIAELNDFLGNSSEVENHLVLAAPTAERQLNEIVTRFSALPLAKLIFTKLDETDQCGALINLPTRANLPLAYLTNGQKVPEDLLLAEAKTVATLVMNHDTESRRMAV